MRVKWIESKQSVTIKLNPVSSGKIIKSNILHTIDNAKLHDMQINIKNVVYNLHLAYVLLLSYMYLVVGNGI